MKQIPIIISLLIWGGHQGLAPAGAMSIKHRLSAQSHQQGIFDRAMRKIEKEETEKQEARDYLQRQQDEEARLEKRKQVYEKNYAQAEQQARQMLASATEDAKITASGELSEMFGLNNAFEEKVRAEQQEQELAGERAQRGFLGSFNVKMNKVSKAQADDQQSIQQKNQAIIDLHNAIQGEVAPSLVNNAVNEALSIKQQQIPNFGAGQSSMDQSVLQRMKDKMHAKLNQHSSISSNFVEEQPPMAQSPLEAYNQLPLKKVSEATQKQMQEDSVSSFLHKVDEQEKEEQKRQEDDEKQRAFEQSVMFGQGSSDQSSEADTGSGSDDQVEEMAPVKKNPMKQVESYEVPEDNPISAMIALKHPEQQKAIEDSSVEEMAQSHYSSFAHRSNPY